MSLEAVEKLTEDSADARMYMYVYVCVCERVCMCVRVCVGVAGGCGEADGGLCRGMRVPR